MKDELHSASGRRSSLFLWAWCAFTALIPMAQAFRLAPSSEVIAKDVVATGLDHPTGLAIAPDTGFLYVAEENANRISMIENQTGAAVISQNFRIRTNIPGWMRSRSKTQKTWTEPVLRKPCALAFDPEGRMYVAEKGEQGRLLLFDAADATGLVATVVVTPWTMRPYSYTSVLVDSQGRLHLTAAEAKSAKLTFGSVLLREGEDKWLLVDYGPFAEFSNVAIDPEGTVLLVAERHTGDVSWYDMERQAELTTGLQMRGIRHVLLLRDGSALASLAREDGTWAVVIVNPVAGTVREWAAGLSEIGGLVEHTDTGHVFLSLPREGQIIRLRRMLEKTPRAQPPPENDLAELNRAYEIQRSLPPKEWPKFFKQYVERLDMFGALDLAAPLAENPGAGTDQEGENEDRTSVSGGPKIGMTIADFAAAIPLVAAKFKARLLDPPGQDPDPVEEISFLLLYPNQNPLTIQARIPSISLFMARRASGRVETTRFMPNSKGQALDENTLPADLPEALISFPSGYFVPDVHLEGEAIEQVFFLGMGLGPDYWIDINRMNKEGNKMRVETVDGQISNYALTPYGESARAGGQSILIASQKEPAQTGWLPMHTGPSAWGRVEAGRSPFHLKHQTDEQPGKTAAAPVVIPKRGEQPDELSESEISFRRQIVLRAAALWKKLHL